MDGVQEQLDREARLRPMMAGAAALAALLTLAGSFYIEQSLTEPPRAWLLDSLGRLESGEPIGPQTSLLLPFYDYVGKNITTVVVSHVLSGVGIVLFGVVLLFLARATMARTDALPRIAPRLPLLGAVPFAIGLVVYAVGTGDHYALLESARTVDGVQNADTAGTLLTGQTIRLVGAITMAAGIAFVCLHAMRVGLLTRFLGVLGILVAVVLGFSTLMGAGSSPVMIFWLFALALLISGRWPGGDPPAWRTGRAVPWPTSAELREARVNTTKPAPGPAEEKRPKTNRPSPATSAKKKRKRRG